MTTSLYQHQLYALHRKITRCIVIKLNLYRDLQELCQADPSFLDFNEEFIDFRYFFEDVKTYGAEFDGYSQDDLLEACAALTEAKDRTLKDLEWLQVAVEKGEPQGLDRVAILRIDSAIDTLEENLAAWLVDLDNQLSQLYDIYQILDFRRRLEDVFWFHRNALRNLINQRLKVDANNAQDFLIDNSKHMQASVQTHFNRALTLVRMFTNSDDSTEEHVARALEMLQDSAEIPQPTDEDVEQLRLQMFPEPVTVSLEDQKQAVELTAGVQKRQLGSQLQQIECVEEQMEQLQVTVEELTREQVKQREHLEVLRQHMHEGMFELSRLQKLIRAIDEEISRHIQAFQTTNETMDAQRVDIGKNSALSAEEKEARLAEVEVEALKVKQRHSSVLMLLKDEKDELVRTAKAEAEKLDEFKEQLAKNHQDEIAENERQMLDATSSEAVLLRAKIEQLNADFDDHLEMVKHFKEERVFANDEHGRYYIDSAGRKVYKRDSAAAEYVLNELGEWVKVQDGVKLLMDDKGEYYLDQFGQKVFVNTFASDEFGRYCVDADGRKVYKTPSGQLVDAAPQEEEDAEKYSPQTEDNFKYIQTTVGKPLVQGLASIVLTQPQDPIKYLANFLLQYERNEERYAQRDRELQALLAARHNLTLTAEDSPCGLGAKTSSLK